MKKAFTLIELLVVIAIIAILAAILFPVFAQAKAAAKSAADLSNIKQAALGITMYSSDYDDMFPCAIQTNNSGYSATWAVTTQPYTKSVALYKSPLDSGKLIASGSTAAEGGWSGVAISIGANAYIKGWGAATSGGPLVNQMVSSWFTTDGYSPVSSTSVTKPSDTIMLADRFTSDLLKAGTDGDGGKYGGNSSAFSGSYFTWTGGYDAQLAGGAVPTGTLSTANAWPKGPGGGVSVTNAGKSNFAYTDGHAKSANPASTNPDPTNQAAKNQWDSTRSDS